MSLYRETRRTSTRRVAIASAVLLAVLAGGFGIGRATAPPPSLQDQIATVRAEAGVVADALELVPLHYESSNASTRQAARDQLARAQKQFADVQPQLALLDRGRTAAAAAALEEVERLTREDAPPTEVEAAATRARLAVRAAAGIT